MIRRAETDADLRVWCDVWTAITPREPVNLEDVKRRIAREPERLYLVADDIGAGFCGPSQSPERTAVAVRVLPDHRRRGLGTKLLDHVMEYARTFDAGHASSMVSEDDKASLAWTEKRGFEEYDRQVELTRELTPEERPPEPPRGIELVELDESRFDEAYALWVDGFGDIPATPPVAPPSYREWLEEEVSGPITFLALDDGRVIGAAALLSRAHRLGEHGLTVVLPSHRRRGIATALKQAQIYWAAANGYRELTTWTQDDNAAMQAVNQKLGYRPRPAWINVWKAL